MARKRQSQVLDPLEEAARRDREQQADVSSSSPDQYGRPFRRMIAERANKARQAGKTVFRTFSDSSARQDLDYPSKPKAKPIDNKRLQEAVAPDTERARVYPEVDPNAVKLLPPVDDVTPIRKPTNKGIKLLPPVTNQRQPQRDSRLPSGNTRASMEMPATQQSSVQPVAFTSPQAWGGVLPPPPQMPLPAPSVEQLPTPPVVENVPPAGRFTSQAPLFAPQQPTSAPAQNAFAPPQIAMPQGLENDPPAYDRQAFADPSGTFTSMNPVESFGVYNDVLAKLSDIYEANTQRAAEYRRAADQGHILHYLVPGRRSQLKIMAEDSEDRAMEAAVKAGEIAREMYASKNAADTTQLGFLQTRAGGAPDLAAAATVPTPGVAARSNLSSLGRALIEEANAARSIPSDAVVQNRNMLDAQKSMTEAAQLSVQQGMATDPMGQAQRMGLPPQMGAVAGGMQLGIPYTMAADENINPFYGSAPAAGSTGGIVFGDQTMGVTAQWLQEQIGSIPATGGPSNVAATLANTPSIQGFALSIARQTNGDVQRTQDALEDYIGSAIYTKLFQSAGGNLTQEQAQGLREFVRRMMTGIAQEAAAKAR